jgi:hypothetical protein
LSVPSWNRTVSQVEFLHTFHKLRKEVILILMRDFGVKSKIYTFETLEKMFALDNEDAEQLKGILTKNHMSSVDAIKYPDWLINTWRSELLKMLNSLGVEIELANNIYSGSMVEYNERRLHWTLAIGYCHAIKDKLNEIIGILDVKVGAYEVVTEYITTEIKLLKGVRKSDTSRAKKTSWWVDK